MSIIDIIALTLVEAPPSISLLHKTDFKALRIGSGKWTFWHSDMNRGSLSRDTISETRLNESFMGSRLDKSEIFTELVLVLYADRVLFG